MNNIEGKVVIITGASSGIGEATAKKLGNLGAKNDYTRADSRCSYLFY